MGPPRKIPAPAPAPAQETMPKAQPKQTKPESETSLLESYLRALDTYTVLRSTLSQALAGSFLDLSRANFHGGPMAGRRFDGDWFDERAKAAFRVEVGPGMRDLEAGYRDAAGDADGDMLVVKTVRRAYSKPKSTSRTKSGSLAGEGRTGKGEREAETKLEERMEGMKLGEERGKSGDRAGWEAGVDEKGDAEHQLQHGSEEEEFIPNPIHQFGILVPWALRTAQSGFEKSLDLVVRVVLAQRELERLEQSIDELRRRDKHEDEDIMERKIRGAVG